MVERGGLENRCPRKGTQGSNPCLSARTLSRGKRPLPQRKRVAADVSQKRRELSALEVSPSKPARALSERMRLPPPSRRKAADVSNKRWEHSAYEVASSKRSTPTSQSAANRRCLGGPAHLASYMAASRLRRRQSANSRSGGERLTRRLEPLWVVRHWRPASSAAAR